MADKKTLDQMLKKRGAAREAVTPVDLYGPEETTRKQVNQQTSKEAKQQETKPVKKYATYLKPEAIKALKRYAFEHERKDYEVLQEALDEYLTSKGINYLSE